MEKTEFCWINFRLLLLCFENSIFSQKFEQNRVVRESARHFLCLKISTNKIMDVKVSLNYFQARRGTCKTVSESRCKEIAKANGIHYRKIKNPFRLKFPPGCYHKRETNTMYFNIDATPTECNYAKVCICADGKSFSDFFLYYQITNWVLNNNKSPLTLSENCQKE